MSRGDLESVSAETRGRWRELGCGIDVNILRFLPYFDMSCNDRRIVTRRISSREFHMLDWWAARGLIRFTDDCGLHYLSRDFHDLVATTLYEAYSGPQEEEGQRSGRTRKTLRKRSGKPKVTASDLEGLLPVDLPDGVDSVSLVRNLRGEES